MAHVGWGTEPFGSLNCRDGQFDSAHYFHVVLGLPVWFSYRGCFHVASISARTDPRDVARLGEFADRYSGAPVGAARRQHDRFLIPLRDSPPLKRMMLFYWSLWLTGLMAVMAVIATSAVVHRGVMAKDVPWLAAFWAGFAAFVPSFVYYHYLRRARGRSARIREVVAQQLGPFSDPAEWVAPMAMRVLPNLGVTDFAPEAIESVARKKLSDGSPADALVVVRLAIGLHDPPVGSLPRRRAEDSTDTYLRALAAGIHTP